MYPCARLLQKAVERGHLIFLTLYEIFLEKIHEKIWRNQKQFVTLRRRIALLQFLPQKNPTEQSCSQACGRGHGGGSVYLRSQPATVEEEAPRETTGARAGNEKRAILSCIGIYRQVSMAAAHR